MFNQKSNIVYLSKHGISVNAIMIRLLGEIISHPNLQMLQQITSIVEY